MRYMIFGAGLAGREAFEKIGAEQVDYFIDNSKEKQGTLFCGKPVISVEDAAERKDEYHVIVTSIYAESMMLQLKTMGFAHVSRAKEGIRGFYENTPLIFNPYEYSEEATSEEEWIKNEKLRLSIKSVNDEVELLQKDVPLFSHIEIETVNRCNGSCEFCPVNHRDDPREYAMMTEEMFQSIVKQLEELEYSGRFTTFSNNEPLLDERIIDFNRYARKHLPKARMHMYTNGTLLTLDKFQALVEVLDELIIDNYQQDLQLIKPCREIVEYCKEHPQLESKVTIVLRKPKEILTSRGGTAPNRKILKEYGKERCVLPFKQMIVRPTGQISLCCNDAIGKYTLGDLNKEKLVDIWFGPRFQMVRKCLYEGRENWGNCKYCDTFFMG